MPEPKIRYTAWEKAQILAAELRGVKRAAALGSDAAAAVDRRRAQIDAKARARAAKNK